VLFSIGECGGTLANYFLLREEMSIKIEVEFFAFLRRYSPKGERMAYLLVEEGATLVDLLAKLNIPEKVEVLCLVNGSYYPKEKALQQGDVVSILPMVDGG
jgi:sulfur carrier protein ThiS